MSRFVARLAQCAGRLDDEDRFSERALVAHRGAGAVLFVAHTQRQHAELLLDRDLLGDRTAAEAKLAEAGQLYRDLGLAHLHAQPTAVVFPPSAPSVFRRDGDVCALRYREHEARVQHVKGLTVLARLLAEPGRYVVVAEFPSYDEAMANSNVLKSVSSPTAWRICATDLDVPEPGRTRGHSKVRCSKFGRPNAIPCVNPSGASATA